VNKSCEFKQKNCLGRLTAVEAPRIDLANIFFQRTKALLAEAEQYISPFVPIESYAKGLQRLRNCFYFKRERASKLLLLSENDVEMDDFHSNMDELFTCLKRLQVYFEKTAGDLS